MLSVGESVGSVSVYKAAFIALKALDSRSGKSHLENISISLSQWYTIDDYGMPAIDILDLVLAQPFTLTLRDRPIPYSTSDVDDCHYNIIRRYTCHSNIRPL